MHWVLLKRYKEYIERKKETENIKKKAESIARQASEANRTQAQISLNITSRNDTELHVVKTVRVRINVCGLYFHLRYQKPTKGHNRRNRKPF